MKSVLVIGGAGRTGAQVCDKLHSAGIQPIYFDNLSTGNSENIKFGPLVKVDAKETPRLVRSINEYQCQTIIHCALCDKDSETTDKIYDQNLGTAMSAINAVRTSSAKKIIFLTSNELPANSALKNTFSMIEQISSDCAKAYELQIDFLSLADFNPSSCL